MTAAFANDNHFTFSLVSEEVVCHTVFSPSTPKFVSLVQEYTGLQSCETVLQGTTRTCLAWGAVMDERLPQGAGAPLWKPPYPRSFHPSVVPVRTTRPRFRRGDCRFRERSGRKGKVLQLFFVSLGTDCAGNQRHAHATRRAACAFTNARVRCVLCFWPWGLQAPLEGRHWASTPCTRPFWARKRQPEGVTGMGPPAEASGQALTAAAWNQARASRGGFRSGAISHPEGRPRGSAAGERSP